MLRRSSPSATSGAINTIYGVTSFGDASGCSSTQWDPVARAIGPYVQWIRDFYSPSTGDEMFFYRSTDGAFRYYDMHPNGKLGTALLTGTG